MGVFRGLPLVEGQHEGRPVFRCYRCIVFTYNDPPFATTDLNRRRGNRCNGRDATAFGGGLHGCTADVYREGGCEDYFPTG
jgi:hypothetical protein